MRLSLDNHTFNGTGVATGDDDLSAYPHLVRCPVTGVCTADYRVPVAAIAARIARHEPLDTVAASFGVPVAAVIEAVRYAAEEQEQYHGIF